VQKDEHEARRARSFQFKIELFVVRPLGQPDLRKLNQCFLFTGISDNNAMLHGLPVLWYQNMLNARRMYIESDGSTEAVLNTMRGFIPLKPGQDDAKWMNTHRAEFNMIVKIGDDAWTLMQQVMERDKPNSAAHLHHLIPIEEPERVVVLSAVLKENKPCADLVRLCTDQKHGRWIKPVIMERGRLMLQSQLENDDEELAVWENWEAFKAVFKTNQVKFSNTEKEKYEKIIEAVRQLKKADQFKYDEFNVEEQNKIDAYVRYVLGHERVSCCNYDNCFVKYFF
jgi:hypothetical protein